MKGLEKITPTTLNKRKELFRMSNVKTLKYGILGYPLGHTLSPQIHKRLFEIRNENAEYSIYEIPPERLTGNYPLLKSLSGFNITIPHKLSILDFCDSLDLSAKRYSSVNCIDVKNGNAVGYNTDCLGFLKTIEAMGASFEKTLLLGCGGVGRMMAIEALMHGAVLTVAVREADLADTEKFCGELKRTYGLDKVSLCLLKDTRGDFTLVVNSTPVGMYPNTDNCPLDNPAAESITADALFDAIYNPGKTKLMELFEKKGTEKISGGMSMLVWQAAQAQTIWSGFEYTNEQIAAIVNEMSELV